MAERTGCPIFLSLWSYVTAFHLFEIISCLWGVKRVSLKAHDLMELKFHQFLNRPIAKEYAGTPKSPCTESRTNPQYKNFIYKKNSTPIISETFVLIRFREKLQEIYNRAVFALLKSLLSNLLSKLDGFQRPPPL